MRECARARESAHQQETFSSECRDCVGASRVRASYNINSVDAYKPLLPRDELAELSSTCPSQATRLRSRLTLSVHSHCAVCVETLSRFRVLVCW